ncbi:NUDIX domain-containing protein [Bacteroidota bacterium]
MPGGWTDIGFSPKTMVEKEVWEEAGIKVEARKLLAIFDKMYHDHPPDPYHSYKLFFLCDHISGDPTPGMETHEASFFSKDELPPLSIERNTEKQVKMMFELAGNPSLPTLFD